MEVQTRPLNLRDKRDKLNYLRRRNKAMRDERKHYVSHWRELSEFILPTRGRFSDNDTGTGQKVHHRIINNTATQAARTLAAGMMAGITSPARPWFKLATPDPMMMEYGPVRRWLHFVERLMREVFNQSNLYNALHTMYLELGVFNTACVIIDEDFDDVVRAYTLTVGEYALGLSHRMKVNALSREYPITVWQAVERFGEQNVSKGVLDLYRKGEYDRWVNCAHVIQPNVNYVEGAIGPNGFAFSSDYWERDEDSSDRNKPVRFLRESGYHRFPVLAPRWDARGSDIYGTGPGQEVLGDVKQLQNQELRKGQGIEKMVNPPMVADSALSKSPTSVLPGGVTFAPMVNGKPGFVPAYQVNLPLNDLREDIMRVEQRIKETFYYDLFRMMTDSTRRQITAREVEEKHEEKLILLGPVLERLHDELLNPLIDIVFHRMQDADMLPPPPQELDNMKLQVEYISILAQAQRAIGVGALERFSGYVVGLAQVKPDIIDKVDFDQSVEEYANMLGVPPDIVLSDDVVEERRNARAEAEAQMAQAQQAEVAANVTQKLASAPLSEGGTALDRIVNPM